MSDPLDNLPVFGVPTGIVWGEMASAVLQSGSGLPLAGLPGAFQAVYFPGEPEDKSVLNVSELRRIVEPDIKDWLERLMMPRPNYGPLLMDRINVMGILNVTPDSFSDGGQFTETQKAVTAARQMMADGADIIDIGGESTRPGAEDVPLQEELGRLASVMKALQTENIPYSVDTRKAKVMQAAVNIGAVLINDVSALQYDVDSLEVVAGMNVPVILMHSIRGGGDQTLDMSENPVDRQICRTVYNELAERIAICERAGIKKSRVIVDPGIGFGKTLEGNLELIRWMAAFHGLGVPVLAGVSRKRFVGEVAGIQQIENRDGASVASALYLASQGIQVLRMHDVAETKRSLKMFFA